MSLPVLSRSRYVLMSVGRRRVRLAALFAALLSMIALSVPLSPAEAALAAKGALTVASSSSTLTVGETVDISLTLNTAGHLVNVVQGDVTYPADKLQLLSITSGDGPFPYVFIDASRPGLVERAVSVNLGSPKVSGTNLPVFTMHFQALANGSADIAPAGGSGVAIDNGSGPALYDLPYTTNAVTVTIGSPSAFGVARLSPSWLGAGAKKAVTIPGRGFASGATVTVGGTGVTVKGVSVASSTALKTTLVVAPGTSSDGYRDVTVHSGGNTSTCVACLYLDGFSTQMTGIAPTTVARGHTITLHVVGVFEAGPDYKIAVGSGVTVSNVQVVGSDSDLNNDLYATLKVSSTATKGQRTVTVTSLDNYGVVSCPKCLTIF